MRLVDRHRRVVDLLGEPVQSLAKIVPAHRLAVSPCVAMGNFSAMKECNGWRCALPHIWRTGPRTIESMLRDKWNFLRACDGIELPRSFRLLSWRDAGIRARLPHDSSAVKWEEKRVTLPQLFLLGLPEIPSSNTRAAGGAWAGPSCGLAALGKPRRQGFFQPGSQAACRLPPDATLLVRPAAVSTWRRVHQRMSGAGSAGHQMHRAPGQHTLPKAPPE